MGLVLRRIACYAGLGVALGACGENSGNSPAPATPSAGAAGQASSESPNAAGNGGNQQAGGNSSAPVGAAGAGAVGVSSSGGGGGQAGAGPSGGQGLGGGTAELACQEAPVRLPSASAPLELPVRFTSGGAPLTVGEPTQDSLGDPYRVTLLKIFLSQPELETETGARVPAVFADSQGAPLLYGLQLLDLEDADPKLRMLVAPGQYRALHMTIGLPDACNGGDPTLRKFPLNADSDMYWSWGSSYLFVRFEGQLLSEPNQGFSYHLGALGESSGPRTVRLAGQLPVSESGGPSSIAVSLDVGKVIAPAPEDAASGVPHQISAPWMLDHISQDAFSLGS